MPKKGYGFIERNGIVIEILAEPRKNLCFSCLIDLVAGMGIEDAFWFA